MVGRYIRLDITSNHGGCCAGIGEIAVAATAVPEPSALMSLVAGIGLLGLLARHRTQNDRSAALDQHRWNRDAQE